jgi:hypothetical protein
MVFFYQVMSCQRYFFRIFQQATSFIKLDTTVFLSGTGDQVALEVLIFIMGSQDYGSAEVHINPIIEFPTTVVPDKYVLRFDI